MGTAKSDDEAEEGQPHPLAQNRPGVYVQVVATPRKRKAERMRSETDAASAPPRSEQARASSPDDGGGARSGAEVRPSMRESGVEPSARARPVSEPLPAPPSYAPELAYDALADREALGEAATVEVVAVAGSSTENTNHRADLMKVPGPPRMPTISLSGAPLPPKQQAASLLDAPRSLRPDSLPSQKKVSWGLLAFVAALSAIITAAGVVAVRERGAPQANPAPAPSEPARAAAQPAAAPSAAPVQQAAPAPEPSAAPSAGNALPQEESPPVAAAPLAAPSPVPAQAALAAERAPAPPPQAVPAAAAPVAAPQPLRKPTPAPVVRRPAAAAAAPSAAEAAPAAAPNPAQIIAEHARALAPVELPASNDTSLPANPYAEE